jgi:hypothetical protein
MAAAFMALGILLASGCASQGGGGKVYYVDGSAPNAADSNPGTDARPWKTLNRAGKAKELKPGDTVFIKSGIYREDFWITANGELGKPITFAAAPGARVVIKGSELITKEWMKVTPEHAEKEPYPNAYQNVWKIKLGEEFFTDPSDPGAFADKAKRNITQVILSDRRPLQPIGPGGAFYVSKDWLPLEPQGRGLEDLRTGTFYFDPKSSELYVKVGGEPGWFSTEVGVRTGIFRVENSHDLVISGLDVRHCRGGLAGIGNSQRIILEDCKFTYADMNCLGIGGSKNCTVRHCDICWGGNSGLGMGVTEDCTIEDCAIMFNNYRGFGAGWGDGGMKNIPFNKRTTIQRCEVAYNFSGGIWFDMLNTDTRILDNVCHHNVGDAIDLEVNFGPNVIAGNLCYANGGSGIQIDSHPPREWMRRMVKGQAGDENERREAPGNLKDYADRADEPVWIVNNTVADNANGITTCDSAGPAGAAGTTTRILRNARVMNNLFLRNSQAGDPEGKYVDMRFWIIRDQGGKRTDFSSHSDYNVFAAGVPVMLKPDYHWDSWGKERTLAEWQKIFNEDLHSRIVPIRYECSYIGFQLFDTKGLDCGGPLPEEVTRIWKPRQAGSVGADIRKWGSAILQRMGPR